MLSVILTESPVLKSALVGTFATVAAAVEQDWKIVWASVALQLGMAAITAFATRRGSKTSRRISRRKDQPKKSPDNGATVK